MNRYWLSFSIDEVDTDAFEYHGPWWQSGYTSSGPNIVAAVCADSEDAARLLIMKMFDREPNIRWRFVEHRDDHWKPFSRRFPQAEWMRWPLSTDLALELRKKK